MKMRFCLSLTALVFACSVLGISLFTATSAMSSGGHGGVGRKLSFGKTILPDNVLYPIMMTVDRVELETAAPNDRIFMEVEYANRRLDYTYQLLDGGKEDLALTTITKAEKYLQNAVHDATQQKADRSVFLRLQKALEFHSGKLHDLEPEFTDAHRVVLDQLFQQNQTLLQSLSI